MFGRGATVKSWEEKDDLVTESGTYVIVEQSLALPGSTKKNVYLDQTLSILLGIQFQQRNGEIKHKMVKNLWKCKVTKAQIKWFKNV